MSSLSTGKILKKLVLELFIYSILCLFLGISINWGFMVWQWHAIFANWWRAAGYMMIFLFIFPILYILQIRSLAVVDTVKHFWHTYRDPIITVLVDKTIERGKKVRQNNIIKFDPAEYIQEINKQFPLPVKRVINFAMAEYPILHKIPEILKEVDLDNPDPSTIRQQILFRLEAYVGKMPDPVISSGMRKLIAINIIFLAIIYSYIALG